MGLKVVGCSVVQSQASLPEDAGFIPITHIVELTPSSSWIFTTYTENNFQSCIISQNHIHSVVMFTLFILNTGNLIETGTTSKIFSAKHVVRNWLSSKRRTVHSTVTRNTECEKAENEIN